MKKYSVAVCVCAVLFFVGIHGGMREVFARAPGADENLAILQDIITVSYTHLTLPTIYSV